MSKVNLKNLKERIANANVYDLAKRTPCQLAEKLSYESGREIWLKREDLQDVFSFKIRGAANRISNLSYAEKLKGVCAASAGNHAQGMAAAAQYYQTKAVIFMPITTPKIKINAVRAAGAETRLVGENYDESCEAALSYSKETGAIFIHPFDELDVIAGQGTVGKEILEQMTHAPDAIYVCTGGGGLISGIGTWVKSISSDIKIIAVEPEGAATLQTSLKSGRPVKLDKVDGFADGVAVKTVGSNTFEICQIVVDETIIVTNAEICSAVKDIFEATRTLVEPAGALALAGFLKQVSMGTAPKGISVATISGANVNFDRIGNIVEQAELGSGQEMLFAAEIAEKKGAFLEFVKTLDKRDISEFNYRYSSDKVARVFVGVKTQSSDERYSIINSMKENDINIVDLSEDRLSKRHLRHMVGGRSAKNFSEKIYRFDFPERPGALINFLTSLNNDWDISLFHYRNHGASTGHVLCGFKVENNQSDSLELSLSDIGYPMTDETQNIAYDYFLRN